jgi:hypothetical protein
VNWDASALRPLPKKAAELCRKLDAPERLVAHLTLVHDVAVLLVEGLRVPNRWPYLAVDEQAVYFGAATHDIGKIVHRAELSEPGHKHEQAGRELLERNGVSKELARFAVTHASWKTSPVSGLEDLLVALADSCWKGKREEFLEKRVCDALAKQLRSERWKVFDKLDTLIEALAADADERLAWQALHPV